MNEWKSYKNSIPKLPLDDLNLQVFDGQVVQSTNSIGIDDKDVEVGLVDDHSLLDLTGALLNHIVSLVLSDV